jgi:Right handed beta helix region
MRRTLGWILVSLLAIACSSEDGGGGNAGSNGTGSGGSSSGSGGSSTGSGGGSATGGSSSTGGAPGTGGNEGTGGDVSGSGGSTGTGGDNGGSDSGAAGAAGSVIMVPDGGTPSETICGDVNLAATRIIDVGKVVAICAGANIKAAATASLTVRGTLLIQGAQGNPVKLSSAGTGKWPGLIVETGGNVISTYAEIHGAAVGVTAKVNSSFWFDRLLIDTADALLDLSSSGSISHAVMHGAGKAQSDIPILISSASPKFTDVLIDNGPGKGGSPDTVIIKGAASAASFDHVEISSSHCTFHFNGGSGCSITNSYIHDAAYGLMVEASQNNKIEHNNFQNNTANLGECRSGGSVNATGNYFQGSAFDDSCQLTSSDDKDAPFTDVGPRGL